MKSYIMDIFERYANESNIEADEKLENSDMNPETVLHESGGFYTAVERLIEERCIFMYSLLEKGVCVRVCLEYFSVRACFCSERKTVSS